MRNGPTGGSLNDVKQLRRHRRRHRLHGRRQLVRHPPAREEAARDHLPRQGDRPRPRQGLATPVDQRGDGMSIAPIRVRAEARPARGTRRPAGDAAFRPARLRQDVLAPLPRQSRPAPGRTALGELIVMPPAGTESGGRNASLTIRLGIWAEADGTGRVFDSSTGFRLPNGATVSPDASWIELGRWEAISPEERRRFAPICPDFVVEADVAVGLAAGELASEVGSIHRARRPPRLAPRPRRGRGR